MSTHRQGPLWAQSLLYAVTSLLLVGRRVRPLLVLLGIWAVSTFEFALFGSPEGNAVALSSVIAVYTGVLAIGLPLSAALHGRATGAAGALLFAAASLGCAAADSLDALESEPATREFFGDEFITAYTTMRRYELSRIADHVSDWERTEYLELF